MSLNIFSININGFRSKRKQLYIKNFLNDNNVDILCIQETFIEEFRTAKKVENLLNLHAKLIWSFGDENSKGVLIILNNKDIHIEQYHIDMVGRLVYVDFNIFNKMSYRLINVYCPNDCNERNGFLSDMVPHLVAARQLILVGDFNFILNTQLDKIGGNPEKGTLGSSCLKL